MLESSASVAGDENNRLIGSSADRAADALGPRYDKIEGGKSIEPSRTETKKGKII